MVSEKEKFAAMVAQLEDTGYNWTDRWRVNSKGVCMTAKMREDRETITTTSTPLNTMDEMAYRELQTENKNLKNLLGDANDKITVLQLRCDRYEIMRLTILKKLQEMKDDLNDKENK